MQTAHDGHNIKESVINNIEGNKKIKENLNKLQIMLPGSHSEYLQTGYKFKLLISYQILQGPTA